MHYSDMREAQTHDLVNTDPDHHKWEMDTMPVLHSGLTTGCVNDPSKNILYLSLYYDNGTYIVRLQDKSSKEKAFLEVSSLKDLFKVLEVKLKSGKLVWKPDRVWTGNGSARA